MFGAPYTGYLVLAFLVSVIVLMAFDYPVGTFTLSSVVVIVPLLVAGWFAWRKDIARIAAERASGEVAPHTGSGVTARRR